VPVRPAVVDSAIALERIVVPTPREKPCGPPTLGRYLTEQLEANREMSYSKSLRQHRDAHIAGLRKRKKDYELEREERIRQRMSAQRFRYHKMGSREASMRGANLQLV